jgi:Na+/H+-dicarboxylate symporter
MWTWILIALAFWMLIALIIGLALGQVIRRADEEEGHR